MSFLSDADIVIRGLNTFYEDSISARRPVINQEPLEQIVGTLGLDGYVRHGGLTGESLADFLSKYLVTATSLYHPEYLGHQVAVPHPNGPLGSLIDGFTANPMAIYEMGPGATSIEYFVINWMLEKIGWQPAPLDRERSMENHPHVEVF